ncbi:MAG: superoxide dismutase [Planctomycetes bacterium]|nr:superoxide dismutase [Planctomycetota bacterium]
MKNTTQNKLIVAACLAVLAVSATVLYSHCQIPCGIYDDNARFDMIAENITTIEKSMDQINELSAQKKPSLNQIVRWVQNKEKHADDTSHIITYYFMAQRLKPVAKDTGAAYKVYIRKLTLLHEMLVNCMKAKQTTDLAHVEKLRGLLAEFKTAYFSSEIK